MLFRFRILVLLLVISAGKCRMAAPASNSESGNEYTLNSVREALVRQEDTIIFNLIERAKFPINSHTYDQNYTSTKAFSGSLVEFLVKNTEAIQAKVTLTITFSLSLFLFFLAFPILISDLYCVYSTLSLQCLPHLSKWGHQYQYSIIVA